MTGNVRQVTKPAGLFLAAALLLFTTIMIAPAAARAITTEPGVPGAMTADLAEIMNGTDVQPVNAAEPAVQ